jgi:tetratricopeptide (TPR) repeat protein
MLPQESRGGRHRPLIGRIEIRTAITGALTDAKQGKGSVLVVVGDEGVGKSTILAFAMAQAQAEGFEVGATRAAPTESPRPFGAVQEMLGAFRGRASGGVASPPEGAEPFSLLLAPLERQEDRIGSSGGPGGDGGAGGDRATRRLLSALADLPRRNDQSRFLLIDRLIEDLATLAERQPLFLGIDDFASIDDSSLEFVTELARHISEYRILLAIFVGPPAVAPVRPRRFLESIRGIPSTRWLEARPLTPTETGELLQNLRAGPPPSPEEVLRWHRRTRGNPLALEQLLRGTSSHLSLPSAADEGGHPIEDMDRARIQDLPEAAQRLLCYAAVIGNEFAFETLTGAVGPESDQISGAFELALRDGIIREARPGRYTFVRESVRQELYAGLTESRRRILHRKVAESLEATASGDPGEVFELARHFYLARDWARALEYCRRAADISAMTFAFPEAKLHLERVLECIRHLPTLTPTVEFRVDCDLGRILVEIGELRQAIDVLNTAVARAREDPSLEPELPIAILWAASAHGQLWEHAKSRELAKVALDLFERASDATGTAIAHRVLGRADWDTGDFANAEYHHREAARLAQTVGNTRVEAHALIDLANVLIYSGPARATEALELYDRAASLFESAADHPSLARVRMNRSILLNTIGRREDALREIAEAEVHAEASGSLLWRVYTILNEAIYRAEAGETTQVRLLLTKGRELNRRLRDRLSDKEIAMIEGMLLENEDDLPRARDRFLEGLRLVEELEMIPDVLEIRYRLARLAVRMGDWVAARQQIQAAFDGHVETIRGDLYPKIVALVGRLPASEGAALRPPAGSTGNGRNGAGPAGPRSPTQR